MVLKRFWKLITLLIVIITILVTYFVHTALVIASQFPELEIKTISGDETTLKNMTISGDYYEGDQYSSALMVSPDNTTYYEELSYFEKRDPRFPPNEATELKDKYRNFMRGKIYQPSLFFENDDYLAYVGAEVSDWTPNYLPTYHLEVDVLNKESNTSTSFQTTLPGMDEIHHVDVLEVRMDKKELKVIVNVNYYLSNQYVNDIKVYTMDISSEKIVGDQTLFDPHEQSDKDKWSHLNFLNDLSAIDSTDNLLLQKDIGRYKEVDHGDEYEGEINAELMERKFYVYDLKANQQQELLIPENHYKKLLSNEIHLDGSVSDTHAYITYLDGNNLVVLSFSLDKLKLDTQLTFDLKELGMEAEDYGISLIDDKLYVLENDMQKSTKIFVGDITNGEVLYQGEIVLENNDDKSGDVSLQFYTITKNE
jgi:hypothetical protein